MRFVIWGDSKGKENGINKKVLNSIMHRISELDPKPECMIMLGDTVAGSFDEEILIKQLFDLKDIIHEHIPQINLIPIIGNHEVNIEPKDDSYEKIICQFYYDLKPDGFLQGYNKSVYYKDFENTRIIVLNSHHPNEIHKISSAQLEWLKNISYKCNKNKLLFVHSPAYPTGAHLGHSLDLYPDNRNKFWKTVEDCNIDIVFSGHEHNYSRRRIKNKLTQNYIYQIITGGAGEKLRNKCKSKNDIIVSPKAIYHFLIADIDDKEIRICALTYRGKKIDEFKMNCSNHSIY